MKSLFIIILQIKSEIANTIFDICVYGNNDIFGQTYFLKNNLPEYYITNARTTPIKYEMHFPGTLGQFLK